MAHNSQRRTTNTLLCSLIVSLSCLLLLSNPVMGKMRSNNKIRAGIPPYEILKQTMAANKKAIASRKHSSNSEFAPYITWLTDSDSRIALDMVLGKKGKSYSIRNLGNQLELATGAIDFGIRHMLTPVLLITANSDNKAIKYFMEGYGHLSPAIRRDLDHLHLALAKDNKKDAFKERLITNIEANVDYQVDLAMARYQDRVHSGRLIVIGSILDITNDYKRDAGRLIIININGVRDQKKLRTMQVVKSIKPELVKLHVGRQRPKPLPKPAQAKPESNK